VSAEAYTTYEGRECSETSAYKIQRPGVHPEARVQHTEYGESLKTKVSLYYVLGRGI
jgi:hypothetical protein